MEQPKTPNDRNPADADQEEGLERPGQSAPSGTTHKSSKVPRSRKPGRAPRKRNAEAARSASLSVDSLEKAIELERVLLMQVQAMLTCLYEVLLYADDDDSLMHADVANVAARLIGDSVVRLEQVAERFKT